MGCGFELATSEHFASEQGHCAPFSPKTGRASCEPPIEVLLQDQTRLKNELTAVKDELAAEKAQNAKRCADLLSLL